MPNENQQHLMGASGETYRLIQKAMISPSPMTVCFSYTDKDGQSSHREVEPYDLRGDTLWGWCLERNAIRQFKLAQMAAAHIGKPFRAVRRDAKDQPITLKIPTF